jgi:hypothetical protein
MKERRRCRRFPIERPVSFQVLNGREQGRQGRGQTVNIGSRGVLLAVEFPVAEGILVEVSLQWPAKLDNRSELKLVLRGSVVRTEGNRIAVRIQKHEFRMAGRGGLFLVTGRSAGGTQTRAAERGQEARLEPALESA